MVLDLLKCLKETSLYEKKKEINLLKCLKETSLYEKKKEIIKSWTFAQKESSY